MKSPRRPRILNDAQVERFQNGSPAVPHTLETVITPRVQTPQVQTPKPYTPQVAKPNPSSNTRKQLSNDTILCRENRDIIFSDNLIYYEGREEINENQVKYVSAEQMECDSAIPSSLWQSTMKALDSLKEEIGSIHTFLSHKMNWTQDELNDYLSPEQQDVLALMINQFDKGETPYERGVLLGDTTGFGKGRPLMAFAAYCKMNDIFPVVFTLQDNLFSNLWADILDMNLQHVFQRPLLINAGSTIEDTRKAGAKPLFPKIKTAELKNIIDTGEFSDEFGIIMLSYSQLNTSNSLRQQFLERLSENKNIATILDESQAIVEMSATTSVNVGLLIKNSYVSINSSATSARHIQNMSSYIHIYPWLEDMTDYEASTMEKDKRLWLSSLSVEKAVASGRMLRREHDMSGLELEMHLPDAVDTERFRHISDEFAYACRKLMEFHSLVSAKVDEFNGVSDFAENIVQGEAQQGVSEIEYKTLPIFQRLHPISRQLLACMMAEQIVKRSIISLEKNEKPFIVMDMTMEAALSRIADDNDNNNDDNEDADINEEINDLAQKPLTIKDLMRLCLNKLCEVSFKKKGTKGKSEVMIMDESHIKGFKEYYEDVLKVIDNMSDLPASPMDYIREKIEYEGEKRYHANKIDKPWKICEISGRSRRIENGHYVSVVHETKNALIAGFNSGDYDAIIASRKASTGLSAHSSSKFIDQRPRRMIEGLGCDNPLERKQMFGRIDRRGQIYRPKYETTNIGTPYNIIKIATDNAKSIELSTAVSASGSGGLIADVPNLLGELANSVARDLLSKNQDISKKLGIVVSEENSVYAGPMFRRCFVLSSKEQDALINEFSRIYAIKSKDYEESIYTDMGNKWNRKEQILIEPGKDGLNDAVFMTKIERYVNRESFSSRNIPNVVDISPDVIQRLDYLTHHLDSYLIQFKEPFIKSIQHGLMSYNRSEFPAYRNNKIGTENARFNNEIAPFIENARRGVGAYLRDKYGRRVPAILANIQMPEKPEDAFDWHQYVYKYVIPGEKKPYQISLDTIINSNKKFELAHDRDSILRAFDELPSGEGIETNYIMESANPLALILSTQRSRVGSWITWTDTDNIKRNSVMIAEDELNKVFKMNGRIWNPDIAYNLFNNKIDLICGIGRNTLTFKRVGYSLEFSMPFKATDKRIFNKLGFYCANLLNVPPTVGKFQIPSDKVKNFLEDIMKEFPLHYNIKEIDYVLSLTNPEVVSEKKNELGKQGNLLEL